MGSLDLTSLPQSSNKLEILTHCIFNRLLSRWNLPSMILEDIHPWLRTSWQRWDMKLAEDWEKLVKVLWNLYPPPCNVAEGVLVTFQRIGRIKTLMGTQDLVTFSIVWRIKKFMTLC